MCLFVGYHSPDRPCVSLCVCLWDIIVQTDHPQLRIIPVKDRRWERGVWESNKLKLRSWEGHLTPLSPSCSYLKDILGAVRHQLHVWELFQILMRKLLWVWHKWPRLAKWRRVWGSRDTNDREERGGVQWQQVLMLSPTPFVQYLLRNIHCTMYIQRFMLSTWVSTNSVSHCPCVLPNFLRYR